MLSPNTDGAEAASLSITAKEADKLDRSTKRAKKVVDCDGTRSNSRAREPSQGRSVVVDDPKVGYAAALLGSQTRAGSGIFLGGNVGYTTLKRRLDQLWSPIGHFDLVDLPNNFYAARFSSVDAKEWVMLGGPWIIQGHYLTVREWTNDFNPRVSRITKAAVWVQIPNLPMDYHTDLSLRRIGYALGRTMKIDKHTQGLIRGNYARLCVEVEYEGLNLICFHCGRYGHGNETCLSMEATDQVIGSGYGRTNPLATPQHQDSLRAQGAGSVDAAHLQVDGVAANSTCEESSRLVLDPDPDPDGSTLAYEGLNDMEDDFPKVDFQPPDGVILVGRVGEEDEGTMAIDELANHTWPDPGAGMSAMEC
ncbi:hypothetical protein CRG98_037440 [Punica granatum]|uniref:CCHC-type domain-containing protein n=1 Tax=Punica granatum TaxID=22663 RepID=A0A2I0IDZ8_PUNGR|nr:hypothetical protein CRG98_037440 [Punica granatum]